MTKESKTKIENEERFEDQNESTEQQTLDKEDELLLKGGSASKQASGDGYLDCCNSSIAAE